MEIINKKPIINEDDFRKRCLTYERKPDGSYKINTKKAHINTLNFIIALKEAGAFTPLYRDDRDVDLSCLQEWTNEEKKNDKLAYIEKFNYKMITDEKLRDSLPPNTWRR